MIYIKRKIFMAIAVIVIICFISVCFASCGENSKRGADGNGVIIEKIEDPADDGKTGDDVDPDGDGHGDNDPDGGEENDKFADADGDGIYWEIQASGLSGIGNHLIILSGTTDFDWCPEGLFGKNGYGEYENSKLGMNVKVSEDITFYLGGLAGNWTVGKVTDSAQTVKPEDGWKRIEFDLSDLVALGTAKGLDYRYFAAILTDKGNETVFVDTVEVDGESEEFDLLSTKFQDNFPYKHGDPNYIEDTGTLMKGLVDLRPAKLADDKAQLVRKRGEDYSGDGRYWIVNVENLMDGTLALFTINGMKYDFDWSPVGLFGESEREEYCNKTLGFWVKSNADATLTLRGMTAGWQRTSDDAHACKVVAGKWEYVEFNLSNLSASYYYFANICANVKCVMYIDGFQILDEPTLKDGIYFPDGKTNKSLAVNDNGADCDEDGWSWAVTTEKIAGWYNTVTVLTGEPEYNVKGVFGTGTLGDARNKYLGMYVYAPSDTTLSLAGMDANSNGTTVPGSARQVSANAWTWVEFNLSALSEDYQYLSAIVSDKSGTMRVDGATLFNR